MKNHLSKLSVCLLLLFAFVLGNGQAAVSGTTQQQTKEAQLKRVNELMSRFPAGAKVTDEQKTKLEASILAAIVKLDNARAEAKGDDNKIRDAKVQYGNDIVAGFKSILTAEQYALVTGEK